MARTTATVNETETYFIELLETLARQTAERLGGDDLSGPEARLATLPIKLQAASAYLAGMSVQRQEALLEKQAQLLKDSSKTARRTTLVAVAVAVVSSTIACWLSWASIRESSRWQDRQIPLLNQVEQNTRPQQGLGLSKKGDREMAIRKGDVVRNTKLPEHRNVGKAAEDEQLGKLTIAVQIGPDSVVVWLVEETELVQPDSNV